MAFVTIDEKKKMPKLVPSRPLPPYIMGRVDLRCLVYPRALPGTGFRLSRSDPCLYCGDNYSTGGEEVVRKNDEIRVAFFGLHVYIVRP